jgi:mRNA interferase MazF
MKRGDVATAALPGDLGKPRPVLIIQAGLFNDTHASLTVVPLSSAIVDAPLFRITLDPSGENGLRKVSQIMVDKIISVRRERVSNVIGRLGDDTMLRVSRALAVWLGIA